MGDLQAKSMTSQRYRAVTRWRICVTMAALWQQQDGGYALLWQRYDNNKMAETISVYNCVWQSMTVLLKMYNTSITSSVYDCSFAVGCVYWACYRCILHLQQYSHRLNLFFKWDGCNCRVTGLRPLQGAVVSKLAAKREKTRKEQILWYKCDRASYI